MWRNQIGTQAATTLTYSLKNVSIEKYKYFRRKECRGGEAESMEMFAKEYLTAP